MDHQTEALIQRLTDEHHLHLVELSLKKTSSRLIIRVFVDTEAGVTIDQCSALSRAIDREMEAAQLISEAYTLEVSSPGVDRPLTEPWQFQKHVGRRLKVAFINANKSPDEVGGKLDAIDGDWLVLHTGRKSKPTEVRIPFDQVTKAVVQLDW